MSSARLRGTIWRLRWMIAAALVGCAVMLVVAHLRPPEPPTTPVVVASRDLPAGTVLTGADLSTLPFTHPPADAVTPEELEGTRLIVGIPEGLPLAGTMVSGPGLAQAAPAGTVIAPVRLADPAILQVARPGDHIDLYLAPADTGGQRTEADLVTAGALILSVPEPGEAEGLFPTAGAATPDILVLAVRAQDVSALTGASSFAPFRAVLVRDP